MTDPCPGDCIGKSDPPEPGSAITDIVTGATR